VGFLERLLQAAETGGRIGSAIEILVLQALAHQMRDDIPTALKSLQRALTLAEPEGYVRMFVDEGEPMRLLIEDLRSMMESQARSQNDHLIAYADKLLDAFTGSSAAPLVSNLSIEDQKLKIENPVEPLSPRELEVLRLFRTELSGPEIARELVVGLSTVRTHTKSIYSKLNVNSRRAAVRRAEELGLI
jgi:LuxR family maltose regulon positive regulatory protein